MLTGVPPGPVDADDHLPSVRVGRTVPPGWWGRDAARASRRRGRAAAAAAGSGGTGRAVAAPSRDVMPGRRRGSNAPP
ncbi:hypothetical protein, partial [Actinomadura fibrosa]